MITTAEDALLTQHHDIKVKSVAALNSVSIFISAETLQTHSDTN